MNPQGVQLDHRTMRKALMGVSLMALVLSPLPAHADSINENYWIEVSYFRPSVDSAVYVEDRTATLPATVIDLEQDLHFEQHASVPTIHAGLKLGNGFRAFFEYFSIDRDAQSTISRDIHFANLTFPATAEVSSSFETDTYRAGVGWDFLTGKDFVLGGAVGLHATNFAIKLEGEASFAGQSAAFESRRRSALAPLPTLGLYGIYQVTPNLRLQGRADYLKLTLNNASGRILNAEAALLYELHDNVALGLGYRHVDMRLEIAKPEWVGGIDYRFNGPHVVLRGSFR